MASSAEKKEEKKTPELLLPMQPLFFDVHVTAAAVRPVEIRDPHVSHLSWRVAISMPHGLIVCVSTRGSWTVEGMARVDILSINGDTTKGGNTRTGGISFATGEEASAMKMGDVVLKFQANPENHGASAPTDNIYHYHWRCDVIPKKTDKIILRITHLAPPSYVHTL